MIITKSDCRKSFFPHIKQDKYQNINNKTIHPYYKDKRYVRQIEFIQFIYIIRPTYCAFTHYIVKLL
jgi:hypothetical protein